MSSLLKIVINSFKLSDFNLNELLKVKIMIITKENLSEIYSAHHHYPRIKKDLEKSEKQKILLSGLQASAQTMFFAAVHKKVKRPAIIIFPDKEIAAYIQNDLQEMLPDHNVLFFPASYKRTIKADHLDDGNIMMRTETLKTIYEDDRNSIIVTYPQAIAEKVLSREKLSDNILEIKKGEEISAKELIKFLKEQKFNKVDFVCEPGQFSVRGSILDIYSYASEHPYRLDFFGDEVETIRTFNIVSQLSVNQMENVNIIPNIQKTDDKERISILEYISQNTTLWIKDANYCIDRVQKIYDKAIEDNNDLNISEILINGSQTAKLIDKFSVVELNKNSELNSRKKYEFRIGKQPDFNKNFNLLSLNMAEYEEQGYEVNIFTDSEKQINRLKEIFGSEEIEIKSNFQPVLLSIYEGFVDKDLKMCCYTDHQIFQRYKKFSLKNNASVVGKEHLTLKEINDLHPGDYVVHVDHGVGKFVGLTKVELNGKLQEAVAIRYKDNDMLYASIHSLHRISKYSGKDGRQPKMHKLGSGVWQRTSRKVRNKVKDIASELILLYAKRKSERGFAFSPDSFLQQELEASFFYEDTPDQYKTTQDVKRDMEEAVPMDRLVCGDVGFGKTEIAIRAAFKAVADNKQVAVLVPTTILALQHYKTFSERLKDFPCTVDYISRLKSSAKQKETLKKLKEGKTDIIIGTHRITGKDVSFKDLGLLIIDEEQKFGVAVKDKLKALRTNVDTLTMTATPIPRTMQFSLMGARDLSIISSPPPNRYPIITELHTLNDDIIRDAINYEIERNGQVFFIHNRVQNIAEIEAMIQRLCPHVKIKYAHGQMKGQELEKIMLSFINGEFDVLISTSIIENGLDIPNANTIIINNAQNFGLSDLHQLRGRVGRSNKKAFCHLIAPPLTTMPDDARKRLKAIEDFSELGSGVNIALQDLDIRGAGNILGGEQSGFIGDIGFETYHRILNETIIDLKESDFKGLFDDNKTDTIKVNSKGEVKKQKKKRNYVHDCKTDTDIDMMMPDNYITNVTERMRLYRKMDNLEDIDELNKFETELIDRFGALPEQGENLLEIVKIRWLAMELGVEKFIYKKQKMICHLSPEKHFRESETFISIKTFIKNNKSGRLKQGKSREMFIFDEVRSIKKCFEILNEINCEL